jgi:hypothetical protein
MFTLPKPKRVVVIGQTAGASEHMIARLSELVPGCETIALDVSPAVESQQIDHHLDQLKKQAIEDKIGELVADRKYTGASHVFVMQGDDPANTDPTQVGMMKAMMQKAMTSDQSVVAVLLPPEEEHTSGEVQENFLTAVAATESLLAPFGVQVFYEPDRAAQHLLSVF